MGLKLWLLGKNPYNYTFRNGLQVHNILALIYIFHEFLLEIKMDVLLVLATKS